MQCLLGKCGDDGIMPTQRETGRFRQESTALSGAVRYKKTNNFYIRLIY